MFKAIATALLMLTSSASFAHASKRPASHVRHAHVAHHATAASLKGSRQSMAFQNEMANKLDLTRVDEKELKQFEKSGILVKLPHERFIKIDSRLARKYRYCRPWTRAFIMELGRRYYDRFGKPLKVTSAVRTLEYQRKLIHGNGNAARGDTPMDRSSHLTGATIDITKKGLTAPQIQWLRIRLMLNEKVHRVEVTEEFNQAVFHIMVLR